MINYIGLIDAFSWPLTAVFQNNTACLELFIVYDSFDVGRGVFGDNMFSNYPFYGVFILFVVGVNLVTIKYGDKLLKIFGGIIFSF